MKYVSEEDAAAARKMEQKIAALPKEAGILFVSVAPESTEDGRVICALVRVGLARTFDEDTGRAIVRKALEEELKKYKLMVGIYRGVAGAGRDEGNAATRTLPS